jgi:hypothetical protein
MKSEIVTIDHDEESSPHAQEVEFALILARMINTAQQDPAQLRFTVYEFARSKLASDITWADEEQRKRLLASLEVAGSRSVWSSGAGIGGARPVEQSGSRHLGKP